MEILTEIYEIERKLDEDVSSNERRQLNRTIRNLRKRLNGRDCKWFAAPGVKGPIPKEMQRDYRMKKQINKILEAL